jgi:hypothetical protein
VLQDAKIRVSMNGRGRWMDNVFIERLWRSLKYECVYLPAFETGSELRAGLSHWIAYYNARRTWSGERQTRHTKQQRRRDWRPGNTLNRAYHSRQTAQGVGATSVTFMCFKLVRSNSTTAAASLGTVSLLETFSARHKTAITSLTVTV